MVHIYTVNGCITSIDRGTQNNWVKRKWHDLVGKTGYQVVSLNPDLGFNLSSPPPHLYPSPLLSLEGGGLSIPLNKM